MNWSRAQKLRFDNGCFSEVSTGYRNPRCQIAHYHLSLPLIFERSPRCMETKDF